MVTASGVVPAIVSSRWRSAVSARFHAATSVEMKPGTNVTITTPPLVLSWARMSFGTLRGTSQTPRATLSQVADHIDHIKKVAGVDHIGLGGDFDGITQVVQGLEDVSTYPALIAELLKRGYTDVDVKKITGGNIMRVMKAVLK